MKSTGILFQSDMIRALLRAQNPKAQTRRIMDPQPRNHPIFCTPETTIRCDKPGWFDADGVNPGQPMKCRFGGPGDELWAKETFRFDGLDQKIARKHKRIDELSFRADMEGDRSIDDCPWTPSIFMPRWASRITLTIDNIRAERVSEISEADAIAEGIEVRLGVQAGCGCPAARAYRDLWNRINAKPVYRMNREGRKFISHYIAYPWAIEDMNYIKGVTDIQTAGRIHATAAYRGTYIHIIPNPYVWAITFHRK